MKLKAKTFRKYFEEIKAGRKTIDHRHLESITFECLETGETLTYEVDFLSPASESEARFATRKHPDLSFDPHKFLYNIWLGKRIG